jgi:hypothetical protein
MIIAVFCNCGKTHFVMHNYRKYNLLDHDLYDYQYGSDSTKEHWLDLYIDHVTFMEEKGFTVLVNAVPEIINRLPETVPIIYPRRELKKEYLGRAWSRHSSTRFMEILNSKWDEWIDYIIQRPNPKYALAHNEYFGDWWLKEKECV